MYNIHVINKQDRGSGSVVGGVMLEHLPPCNTAAETLINFNNDNPLCHRLEMYLRVHFILMIIFSP